MEECEEVSLRTPHRADVSVADHTNIGVQSEEMVGRVDLESRLDPLTVQPHRAEKRFPLNPMNSRV